jgi:hypothetical protein
MGTRLGFVKSNRAVENDAEVAPILLTPQPNGQEVSYGKTEAGSPL